MDCFNKEHTPTSMGLPFENSFLKIVLLRSTEICTLNTIAKYKTIMFFVLKIEKKVPGFYDLHLKMSSNSEEGGIKRNEKKDKRKLQTASCTMHGG